LVIALGRLRQLAVGRRLDFETAIGRLQAECRVVMADGRLGRQRAAAIDRGLVVDALAEAVTNGTKC
jgi:hypothetical protein